MRAVRACLTATVSWCWVLLSAMGCAAWYPPGTTFGEPEFVPTKTIQELLADPIAVPPAGEMAFALMVMPRTLLANRAVRLTCFVPPSWGAGEFRLALEGKDAKGWQRLEHAEMGLLIEHVECGTWVASCQTVTTGRGYQARRETVIARGACNVEIGK